MKPILLALTLAVFSVILWPATDALAQEEKVARGTISELGGASLTIQVRGESLKFSIDRRTRVDAPGGSTKTRQANMNGSSGPHLADVLKIGQSVAVAYKDLPNPMASSVRVIPSAGASGGSVKTASELRSIGTVKAVGADSLTISGSSGGGGTFTQTFLLGPDTVVVGKGAGTASAATGGRAPVTQLISAGDRVSVSYHRAGSSLQASDVRVTMKGSGSH